MSIYIIHTLRDERQNFSNQELELRSLEEEKHKTVIQSKFTSKVTKETKDRVWKSITRKVNAVNGGAPMKPAVLKKKWSNICSDMAKISTYRREIKKTGGGPAPPPLTDADTAFMSILGEAAVSGIEGGVDSSDLKKEAIESTEATEPQTDMIWDISCKFTAPPPTMLTDEQSVSSPHLLLSAPSYRHISPAVVLPNPLKKFLVNDSDCRSLLELISVEKERLAVEQQRLNVKISRLLLEEKLLELEEKRLALDNDKYILYVQKLAGVKHTVQYLDNENQLND